MESKQPCSITQDASLSLVLEALSLVLLGIFLANIIPRLLPLQVNSPRWQLMAISEIVSNGTVPLVGALLTPLAFAFNADSKRLRRRKALLKNWAIAAAIGFALLIPLQAFAAFRVYSQITDSAEKQSIQSAHILTDLRQTIRESKSARDLQDRLLKTVGPQAALPPAQLRTPLPELKRQLLLKADQLSELLQQKAQAKTDLKPDSMIRETVRISLSPILYALGFAFISGLLPLKAEKRKLAFGWGSVSKKGY